MNLRYRFWSHVYNHAGAWECNARWAETQRLAARIRERAKRGMSRALFGEDQR